MPMQPTSGPPRPRAADIIDAETHHTNHRIFVQDAGCSSHVADALPHNISLPSNKLMSSASVNQSANPDISESLNVSHGCADDMEGDMFFQIKTVEDYHSLVSSFTCFDDVSVVNLSDFQLTEAYISLLSKGLNFCLTPPAAELGALKANLDRFHKRLKWHSFFQCQETIQKTTS